MQCIVCGLPLSFSFLILLLPHTVFAQKKNFCTMVIAVIQSLQTRLSPASLPVINQQTIALLERCVLLT